MDSSGQSVSSNPLFNTADTSTLAAKAKAVSTVASSDKILNSNKFSDVLDKQQAVGKVAAGNRSSHSIGVVKPLQDDIESVVEALPLQIMVEGGKPLPAEGFTLPLMAGARAFNSNATMINVAGEGLTATAVMSSPQSSDKGQLAVDADVVATLPESGMQSFLVGHDVGEVMAPIINATAANQTGQVAGAETLAAPLVGIQINNQGQRNGSTLNTGNTSSHLAAAILSTDPDADLANKPVTGMVAATLTSANPLAEFNNQLSLQSSLVQATTTALTVEPGSTSAAAEVASTLGALLAADAPQAYRSSAQTSFQTTVAAQVGKPGWGDAVMERVMWMSSQQINKAEIALDPPELGPLQVRISTHGDQTTVSFTSHHSAVRDALDQGLPRLREMMDSQGLNLADVDVSDQRQQQSQRNNAETTELGQSGNVAEGDSVIAAQESMSTKPIEMKPLSLIDQYV